VSLSPDGARFRRLGVDSATKELQLRRLFVLVRVGAPAGGIIAFAFLDDGKDVDFRLTDRRTKALRRVDRGGLLDVNGKGRMEKRMVA